MAAVLEKQAKRWTYEEYYRLDDDQRYEIIAGIGRPGRGNSCRMALRRPAEEQPKATACGARAGLRLPT